VKTQKDMTNTAESSCISRAPGTDIRNGAYLFVAEFVSNAGMFLTAIVLARSLGIAMYGSFSVLLGIVNAAAIAVDLGMPTSLTRKTASLFARGTPHNLIAAEISGYHWTMLAAATVGAVACAGVLYSVSSQCAFPLTFLQMALVSTWIFCPVLLKGFAAVFNGANSMKWSMVLSLVPEPLKLLFVAAAFVLLSANAGNAVLAWTVASWCTCIFIAVLGTNRLNTLVPYWCALRAPGYTFLHIRESAGYFIPFLGVTLMPNAILLILGSFGLKNDAAFFSAAVSISSASYLVFWPLHRTLLPSITHRFETGNGYPPRALLATVLSNINFVNCAIVLTFLALGKIIFTFTYGAAFVPSWHLLIILSIANFFETTRMLIDPVLYGAGKVTLVSHIELLRYALVIPGAVLAAHLWGATGAAVCVLAISVLCTVVRFYLIKREPGMSLFAFFPGMIGWAACIGLVQCCGSRWHPLTFPLLAVLPAVMRVFRVSDIQHAIKNATAREHARGI
jgi:O-antigen/teichoic acid export membrane protein